MTPEEQTSNDESQTEKPEQVNVNPVPQASAASSDGQISTKDLLVPISVVIAGAFIGLGLFFSGGQADEASLVVEPASENSGQTALQALVQEAGVSLEDVEACVNSGEVSDLVQADVDNALATGGRGTPWSIVIGPNGKKYPLNGAQPTNAINQVIELARSEAGLPVVSEASELDQVAEVTADDHIKGSIDAPIMIVEYSDYDCPFCGRFHDSMNQIIEQNEDVAWVYRHFPLDQLHPNARTVAQISECVAIAEGNDAFWTFTDGYFAL